MEKILITGVCSGLGRLLARELRGRAQLIGVDTVPAQRFPPGVDVHRVDLAKRAFEELVRTERPRVIVHLALRSAFDVREREGRDRALRGTRALLEHCVEYSVERLVALTTGLVYGAFAANPYRMDEGTPTSGAANGAGVRDWVEADGVISSFVWQFPEVRTCLLRPVPILGRTVRSMVASYFRLGRVPTALGFDPMVQLLAEEDAVRALDAAVDHRLRGIFNVVGPGEVPLSLAIRESGRAAWPLPSAVLRRVVGALYARGLTGFPPGLTDFLKYPVSLDGRRFEEATGFQPKLDLDAIFERMRH